MPHIQTTLEGRPMAWTPRPYEAIVLPAAVREIGAKVPIIRDLLRANPFLPYTTWKDLLFDHQDSGTIRYLIKNLDRRRAGHLLGQIPNLELESRQLSDIDLALSAWYNQDEMGETLGRRALASGLPNVAGVALRSKKISPKLKAKLAEKSYRPNRLLWLTSEEADHLPTERLWRIAALPENLEECCERTMLDDMLKTETLQYSAALLAQRPELLPRALGSGDPWWLMAAAAIPLSPEEQETLIRECAEHWEGPATEEILAALSRSRYQGDTAPDPIGLLGTAPWCSPATWAHLEGNAGDPDAVTWVEGEQLVRRNPLGYSRTITLRHAGTWAATDLATCTPQEAERWAERARYSDLLTGPFIALELRKNRHTGRRAGRLRREALLAHSETLHEVLLRAGFKEGALKEVYRYRVSDPETSEPRDLWVALPECLVQDALMVADGGFKELEAAGFTEAEWESALVLQLDFTGTVQDLIGVVRALN